jgi:hypothetical protein
MSQNPDENLKIRIGERLLDEKLTRRLAMTRVIGNRTQSRIWGSRYKESL